MHWFFWVVMVVSAGGAWADPLVDGTLEPGEYDHRLSVIDATATVAWSGDGQGGLFLAVSAPTTGWVGVGIGSPVMDGAWIFLGYVKDGRPVFSQQRGVGHTHTPQPSRADRWAVAQAGETTTVEFHLSADQMPVTGPSVPFIVAYADRADLTTFHEDNHDGGVLTLP